MDKKPTFLLIILLFFSFCTYNNEEELYPNEICDTADISYINDIKPIFEQNCYSCHSNSVLYYGNLSLENINHIQRVVDNGKLLKNIKHEPDGRPMPEGAAKLSDCNINKIEAWVNRGIPTDN
jgi:hypothetical protein